MDNNIDENLSIDLYIEQEIEELKRAEYEAERYIKICKARISEYEKKLKEAEERIKTRKENVKNNIHFIINKGLADGIIDNKSIKETKTLSIYVTPSAKLVFKKQCEKIVKTDDKKLIDYFEANNYNDFIEIKKSPKWGEFKKKIKINNGNLVNEDGEILTQIGIEIKQDDGEFEIKYL